MSTKGLPVSLATRQKISLSKTKHTKGNLIQAGTNYIDKILTDQEHDRTNKDKRKTIPSIVGYCLAAGISRSRLYELASRWQEVADIMQYIGMMQEDTALQGGMTNRLNPIFSMFLLKSKHEYKDTPAVVNNTNNLNITPDLLADALKLMRSKNK